MPFLNNQPLNDVTFVDSLNGWAVTRISTTSDTGYILKTINGGDNWFITNRIYGYMSRIIFLDQNTGFVCGSLNSTAYGSLFKTTNSGLNWNQINVPPSLVLHDMYILNNDTMWEVDEYISGSIYRTTNGGINWTQQDSIFGDHFNKIYMFNRNIGFACTDFQLFKTTNSGENWVQISGSSQSNAFNDVFFIDSLVGWKSNLPSSDSNMVKTTDGGFNWVTQMLPHGGLISVSSGMGRFSKISRDTIWGSNGSLFYGSGRYRGFIWFTSNGGSNWYFQLPDTSFGIPLFGATNFVNNKIGWSYGSYNTGIHTKTGGNDTFFTPIKKISSSIPGRYILFQNYPNPFNPVTKIKYVIMSNMKHERSDIKLIVYDITGKEISVLVNENLAEGEYEVQFYGTNHSSGVYFYSLTVDGILIDTKKMLILK
jgi:photosystem II stability/assembly factor-like uncharacterized protein